MEIDSQNADRVEIEWESKQADLESDSGESDGTDDIFETENVEKPACLINTETELDKMLDVSFYRDTVIDIIVCGLHIRREVYELRYTLFIRAVNFHTNGGDERPHLHPFPYCFYENCTKLPRYDELRLCLANLPSLSQINVRIFLIFTLLGETMN